MEASLSGANDSRFYKKRIAKDLLDAKPIFKNETHTRDGMKVRLNESAKSRILSASRELAGSDEIVAVCLSDPWIYTYDDESRDKNVLIIIRSPRLVLKSCKRRVGDVEVSFLAVDQKTFEKDVEKGWLGELLDENLILPYEALVNEEYLWRQEVKAKKRVISELLGSLILEFPELSHDLLVKPEYFVYETIARMSSAFPHLVSSSLSALKENMKKKYVELMIVGFTSALDELTSEGLVNIFEGYVRIEKKYIQDVKAKRRRLTVLFMAVRKDLFRRISRVFPKAMLLPLRSRELYTGSSMMPLSLAAESLLKTGDSRKYIFMPTPLGHVALSDGTTIEGFVKKVLPDSRATEIDVKKIGGVLNSVYLLTLQEESQERRVVVKLFKDLYGLKWFPLALWTLGTREFSVLGKSRLEKEYAINRLLHSQGVRVPEILYVSPKEKLIFEEFVEGQSPASIFKNLAPERTNEEEIRGIVSAIGKTIAKVHEAGVVLGDCKPENMIITPKGEVCCVDLEQASRSGNQTWDIAEFLFYSGHYFLLPSSLEVLKIVTTEFVEGYLEAGGSAENVRGASSPRYVKVFSFFTPPHVLVSIRSICRKALSERKQ